MFKVLNTNYEKMIRKLPMQFGGFAWKTTLYIALGVCWATILFGTFLLLK